MCWPRKDTAFSRRTPPSSPPLPGSSRARPGRSGRARVGKGARQENQRPERELEETMTSLLPGKLPPELLAELLQGAVADDPRVLIGPRVGVDAAVLDFGERLLVA